MRVTAGQRESRSDDEPVAARPPEPDPRLSAGRVLDLQARAGNQAVAKLLRLSSTGKAALKKKKRAPSVAAFEKWQSKVFTDEDADAVVRGLNGEELTEALELDPKHFKGAADDDDMVKRLAFAKTASAMAQESKPAQPRQLKGRELLVQELYLKGVSDSDARAFLGAENDDGAVRTWFTGRSDPFVRQAVSVCVNKNARLSDLTTLFTLNTGLHAYPEDTVLGWANTFGVGRVTDALNETRADNSLSYVQVWLSTGASVTSVVVFKKLVRLQARILDGSGAITVLQSDRNYAGSHDPPSRTGFLKYAFGNNVNVELHTHWNTKACKVVSIHVKEGDDASTEVNQWAFFAEINQAAVAAHNGQTDDELKPTTDPPGRALTL